MQSMTGYGRGMAQKAGHNYSVEIFSVNRKNLEISTSLSREWQGMEREISDCIRKQVQRGKLHVSIHDNNTEDASTLLWDAGQITTSIENLRQLAATLNIEFQPDAAFLLRLVQVLHNDAQLPEWEDAWETIAPAVDTALAALVAMREQEGAAIREDLDSRICQIAEWVGELQGMAGDTVAAYRDALLQRLSKSGLELDLDDERVLKEIALFADRCDIAEELTRLQSHLLQFGETMASNGSIGRKLDFLCQEINREINTIGSKANNIEITRRVIECKNELERIREQVQNVQ